MAATHVHQLISIFSVFGSLEICKTVFYVSYLYRVSIIFPSVSSVEGMKVVEIEKCRSDIKKLREEMASRNNRSVTSLLFLEMLGRHFLTE